MIDRLSPRTRKALMLALGLLLAWFAWTIRSVLNPLIAGYFLAFCIHPVVLKLERHGWSRKRAVNTIFVAVAAAITLTGIALFFQARALVENADVLLQKVGGALDTFVDEHEESISWLLERMSDEGEAPAGGEDAAPAAEGGVQPIPAPGGEEAEPPAGPEEPDTSLDEEDLTFEQVLGRLGQEFVRGGGARAVAAAEGGWRLLLRVFGTGFAFLSFVFLLPIYTWFLLFELGRVHEFVRRYVPRRERERVTRVGAQIGEVIATFFRGRLLVCLLKGAVLVIGLAVAGFDYALLLGLAGGFLSLVPFVGPMLTGVIAFLIGLGDHGFLYTVIAAVVVFTVAELVEGYILIPKILGDSLGLHPVVILVCVFAGGAALGMFGFLIAIPLTAALVILAREFVLPVLAQLADEDWQDAAEGEGAAGSE